MFMQKESITEIAQLLTAIKELTYRLEKALREKDNDQTLRIKKEILDLQQEVNRKISES